MTSYIGKPPQSGLFKKLDAITVVNAQAAYTLQYNSSNFKPGSASQLIVSVNGVIQAPEDAYTIDGSTITFTENLVTGDVIDFIVALGEVGNTVTPVDGSVTTAKLANDAVTSDKLAHDLTVQTSLSVPTIKDSSGTNTAITVEGGGRIIMPKQPRFCVRSGPAQTATGPAKVQFTNVEVNVGSCWSTTNHRFTAPIAGDYYFFFTIMNNSANYMRSQLYKNGSAFGEQFFNENQTYARTSAAQMFTLAANDYVELYYDINGEGYGDVHSSYRSFVGYLVG